MLTDDRKFLFTFDCIWYRVMEHSSNGYIYKAFLHLRLREHFGRVQKDCKSQEIKEFAVRLCHLVMSEATPTKSHQHDCLNMSGTRTIEMGRPMWSGASIGGLRHTHTPLRNFQWKKQSMRKHTNWLSNTKWPALKTYIQ